MTNPVLRLRIPGVHQTYGIQTNGGRLHGRLDSLRRCVPADVAQAGCDGCADRGERLRLFEGAGVWRCIRGAVVGDSGVDYFRPAPHHAAYVDVHDGGWMHIIGNMIFLWAFGPEIEDAMGRGRYLVFYLLGGLVAMLAQVLASPASTIPSLGASGAIAAVMGAFIITYPRDRIKAVLFFFIFWRITFIPASLLIGFWFLTQVIDVGSVAHVQRGGVAYLAHIGGFLFGVITARWFEDKRRLAWIESQGS